MTFFVLSFISITLFIIRYYALHIIKCACIPDKCILFDYVCFKIRFGVVTKNRAKHYIITNPGHGNFQFLFKENVAIKIIVINFGFEIVAKGVLLKDSVVEPQHRIPSKQQSNIWASGYVQFCDT